MSDEEKNANPQGRPRPVIDADECKSCGRCVNACPRKCLRLAADRLNRRGVKPAEYTGEGCTGCAICFYNCPEPYAIRIEKP
ncbi:MAG TPA: 4Fe-4S dicluster domain-containing protein [Kiritimatiellia bacterium]|jgi:NAD-dependent dihydropyrimidine dehydrogenase PreA subunit|nr:4Fe-4S dicluster domain-containing protein [Kiritimatiellia bacterium]HOM59518.1 4Fe-4S dicluster domain-containing protein [Kiritimatiellia bacterium]HOR98601.1 4Fe-4S dicluster domain-containing protein [Kiritimatiellia bacterium]HPK37874.1 4Fe-4S dicluster domain-containing protein [Kiritimatiellia bacterium]HPW75733.1 4Fe-4S dicluster domain-containing protein [Kiritimatiellia bacterium]